MTIRHLTTSLFLLFLCAGAMAQDFDQFFTDTTLRLDYIFAGNQKEQRISLDKLCSSPHWYGKRERLAEIPVEGNGQVIVRDHITGETIYRNSFSTLFQEWLTYDEARGASRSFENVFLVPMPQQAVDITVQLRDNRRHTTASFTHYVDPTDILIRHIGEKTQPYSVLQKATSERAINIAFVAEGYTEKEMNIFLRDCREAMSALFDHEPFRSKKNVFNIVAVKVPSVDSGTSKPGNGDWRNTALSSHFDTFYSDRYLTTLNIKDLHNALAGVPYEHIIVLVNTPQYGGGGILNSYNLSMTHHPKFREVVVHEFGHSFAGLADEYAYDQEPLEMYPTDIEPWEQNITTKVDFASKWEDMMDLPGIGLFEGAGYTTRGVYRPVDDCRMRSNETPEFCPVCQRALTRIIDFYTAPTK